MYANYVFEGHRVRVSFIYYVNFDLFGLMTIPSNCKIWRTNAVDAYETLRFVDRASRCNSCQ